MGLMGLVTDGNRRLSTGLLATGVTARNVCWSPLTILTELCIFLLLSYKNSLYILHTL